jgi:hypothetical protein
MVLTLCVLYIIGLMRTIHKELLRARMEMIYLCNQSRNNSNLGAID